MAKFFTKDQKFKMFEWSLLFVIILSNTQGIWSVRIVNLDVPPSIKAGSKDSVVLDCDYTYIESERYDLIVRWFFNEELVYKWDIPFSEPEVFGILKDRLNLSYRASTDSFTQRRAIQILNITTDLSGVYKCSIWDTEYDFEDEVMQKRMIVYDHDCPAPQMDPAFDHDQLVAFAGENFTIHCRSQYPIGWIIPANLNSSSPRLKIQQETSENIDYSYVSTLQLQNASYMDTGYYACSCNETTDLEDYSRVNRMYIYFNDSKNLLVENRDVIEVLAIEDEEVTIPCKPTSPDVEVDLLNAYDISVAYRGSLNPRKGFHWQFVDGRYEGTYFCRATRGYRVVEKKYDVKVMGKPQVNIYTNYFYYVHKGTYLLQCRITRSSPTKNVTWYFSNCTSDKCDDLVLPPQDYHLINNPESLTSTLKIKAEVTGNVTCEACNDIGCKNSTAMLRVSEEFSLTGPETVVEGDDVLLTCCVPFHRSSSEVYWQVFNSMGFSSPNSTAQNVTELSIYNYLLLPNITHNMSGDYWCFRGSGYFGWASKNVHILVKDVEPPELLSTNLRNSNVFINMGDQVSFYCFAKGAPQPTVTWYKDDQPLKSSLINDDIQLLQDDRMLIIKVSSAKSKGNYSCQVHNRGGTVSKYVFLDFKNDEDTRTVRIRGYQDYFIFNETYLVNCSIIGFSTPNVKWYFRRCQLDKCEEEETAIPTDFIRQQSDPRSTGIISTVIIHAEMTGILTCGVCNDLGCLKDTVQVIVSDVHEGFSLTGPESVFETDNVTLECVASVYDFAEGIKWYKRSPSGPELLSSAVQNKTEFSYHSYLQFPNITLSSQGEYICQLQHIDGHDDVKEKMLNLSVTEIVPPEFTKTNLQNSELVHSTGENVYLYCFVKGIPQPNVIWYKDDKPLNDSVNIQFLELLENDQLLSINYTTEKHKGKYACQVHNRGGVVSKFIYLDIKEEDKTLKYVEHKSSNVGFIAVIVVMSITVVVLVAVLVKKCRHDKHNIIPATFGSPGYQELSAAAFAEEQDDAALILQNDNTGYRWIKSSDGSQ